MTMLDLFSDLPYQQTNLLPYDGIVDDYGRILNEQEADHYLNLLLNSVQWEHDKVSIMGKIITTQRQVAWFGDQLFKYTYSGVVHHARLWVPELIDLKKRVENIVQTQFNSCLLNLYEDGSQGMAWHSDDEDALGRNTVIASLSLGATRKFVLKHKRNNEKVELNLPHGQLIVMRGDTQHHWLHAIMKSTKVTEPRINLTFRTFIDR